MPGVSAMQAAAARLGAPLGHDFCAISLSDNLKPWSAVERRLAAAAEGDAEPAAAYAHSILRTLADVLAARIERAHADVVKYVDRLVPRLREALERAKEPVA